MGVTLTPLWLRESLKNVGAEFGSESVESREVSGLPLEEAEVSEQPSEGVSDERLEWKEHAVALGTAGRGLLDIDHRWISDKSIPLHHPPLYLPSPKSIPISATSLTPLHLSLSPLSHPSSLCSLFH